VWPFQRKGKLTPPSEMRLSEEHRADIRDLETRQRRAADAITDALLRLGVILARERDDER